MGTNLACAFQLGTDLILLKKIKLDFASLKIYVQGFEKSSVPVVELSCLARARRAGAKAE